MNKNISELSKEELLIESEKIQKIINWIKVNTLDKEELKKVYEDVLYSINIILNYIEKKYIKTETHTKVKSYIKNNEPKFNYQHPSIPPFLNYESILKKKHKKKYMKFIEKSVELIDDDKKNLNLNEKYHNLKIKLDELLTEYETNNKWKNKINYNISKYLVLTLILIEDTNETIDNNSKILTQIDKIDKNIKIEIKKEIIDKEIIEKKLNIEWYSNAQKKFIKYIKKYNINIYNHLIYDLRFSFSKNWISFNYGDWFWARLINSEDIEESVLNLNENSKKSSAFISLFSDLSNYIPFDLLKILFNLKSEYFEKWIEESKQDKKISKTTIEEI